MKKLFIISLCINILFAILTILNKAIIILSHFIKINFIPNLESNWLTCFYLIIFSFILFLSIVNLVNNNQKYLLILVIIMVIEYIFSLINLIYLVVFRKIYFILGIEIILTLIIIYLIIFLLKSKKTVHNSR